MLRFAVTLIAWTLVESASGLDWKNEVNVSMCNWAQFRANVIRDTIYLDGGELWWWVGLSDGSYASPQNDGGINGVVYEFNLGQPFNQSTNITSLFKTLSKTGGLASNNIAPNYVDGAMFANDDELITFGGLVDATNSSSAPAEDTILGYEAYQYGPARQSWSAGFINKQLPTNITRYVTNGASVSAPSENMGYYFSGMRAADWGPIFNDGESANTLANSLISVNMSVMRDETWTNDTLPSFVPARANAEIAWIPAGENGVLVAIGGVIDPVSLTAAQELNSSQTNASTQTSPTFMDTVSVYDIANKKWYQQNTTGDIPPQLTMFCSVVAPARDDSSFNVYIYGGYDGLNQSSIPSDDVYILSVPQMIWTHAYTGQSNHGRSGHKCFMVYPDQMMIIGGIYENNPLICLQAGIAEVFNVNNLKFQSSYDPRVWSEYRVPDVVTAKIGGNGNGSATVQSPASLSDVFATAQDAKSQPDLAVTDIDGATVVSSKTHERHVSEAGSVALHEIDNITTPVYEMGPNDQGLQWHETQWSQPQKSPPLVSPNIDGMMYGSQSPTRPTHQNTRHTSNMSTGYRSDISEIGSSDPGQPAHNRQLSDNSVSDAASVPGSQDGSNVETSNREYTATTSATMSGRITTVREVEEHNATETAVSPLVEEHDGIQRQRNHLTELE
ncbi:hypothetical protein ZTR_06378 [Talaromyces verruculosus]|nr:hypothetical protein ZTR_06378 [Talaromyces verruculosus]